MPIRTERLDLVLLAPSYLMATLSGEPRPDPGFADPLDFLAGAHDVVRRRLEQIAANAAVTPWLLRAIVVRDEGIAVGFLNFHAEPDASGVAELGYEVHPARRRRGYALEAARGAMAWAMDRGVRVVRASVSPANVASLAIVERLGFVHVGEQIDEIDGLELVFEK
jgi:RimJ/RimL family protein N-acetyltransferase